MRENYDVCVVGAGFAGLSCALALLDARPNLRIVVLEAGEKVGGRAETRVGPAGPYDAGAQWVSRGHSRVLALAKRFGIEAVEQQWTGAETTPPDNGDSLLGWLDWFGSDTETVEDFMNRWPVSFFLDSVSKDQLTLLVRSFLACEPREVSPTYLRWSIEICGGVKAVSDGPEGAQALFFRQGAGALAERMSNELKTRGCVIRTGEPVESVDKSRVTTSSGEIFDTRAVVVAVTPPQWGRFVKNMSAVPMALASSMFMGRAIKTTAVYATPVWEGGVVKHVNAPATEVLTATCSGAHTVWGIIVADEARRLNGASYDEILKLVADQYSIMFGTAERPTFFDYADWSRNPRVRGCFSAVPRPGALATLQSAHCEGCIADGAIFYTCTELARDWASYMEGAVSSGHDAAKCIIRYLGS